MLKKRQEFQSVLLECSTKGLFIVVAKHTSMPADIVRFGTPDGEGVKLNVLLSKLRPGDKIRLAFDDRITAPTEKEYTEWRNKQLESA